MPLDAKPEGHRAQAAVPFKPTTSVEPGGHVIALGEGDTVGVEVSEGDGDNDSDGVGDGDGDGENDGDGVAEGGT